MYGADVVLKALDIIALALTGLIIVVTVIVLISRKKLRWWKFGVFFESESHNHDSDESEDS